MFFIYEYIFFKQIQKWLEKMTKNAPCNIVEAYKMALQEVEKNSENCYVEYNKVVDFCDNNEVCNLENSIKKNMLLFWSYDNMAKDEMKHKKYIEALNIWKKAKGLLESSEMRVELGQKMLDAVDRSKLSIPEKTKEIAEICRYMQQAYQNLGDADNVSKMKHLETSANTLMKSKRAKT